MSETKYTENQTAILANVDLSNGAWFDNLVNDIAAKGLVKNKQQAKVSLNQLIKKGTLSADTTVEEGSTWIELKVTEPWFRSETSPAEEAPAEEEDDLLGLIQQDVIEGTPADEVADALAEIEAEETGEDVDTVVAEQSKTVTENYTELEWTDHEGTEWTETTFNDGSRTLKRRKKVSGSWRTDYWGAEFAGDKERYTTSKFAKMARAYGAFSHNPIV
jgi:hypothetical protein